MTGADFVRPADKIEGQMQKMLHANHEADAGRDDKAELGKATRRLRREAAQLRAWLGANPWDRRGATGSIRQSNRTDDDSGKMATRKA